MQVPVMIFVTYANTQGVDTRIKLDSGQSSFEDGYDRLVYISDGQARPGRIARVRRVRITLTNNEFGRDEERITNFLAASSEKRICSITSPEFFSTK